MTDKAGEDYLQPRHNDEFEDEGLSLHEKDSRSRRSYVMLNHNYWCAMLGVMCLRSKTRFAAYLRASFQYRLPPGRLPTVFPIPVPPGDPFGMKLNGLSASKRRSVHRRRALHVMVMAFNFWHSGGTFDDLRWVCRTMTPVHRSIHRRLWAYLLSDGQFPAFQLVRAGRRFHQLGELCQAVTSSGMSSFPYTRDFAGMEVPMDNSLYPELEPYHKMDPTKIRLSGTGHWDVTSLLPDQLCVPYREPAVLANGLRPPVGYGMSWITLQACQLPATSDSLHLSLLGGWTSMAMFRRCFMGLFHEVHHLVDMDFFSQSRPKLLPLPRTTAEELVLAAVLVPLFQTNLSAGYGDYIYATDASEARGAVCRAPHS